MSITTGISKGTNSYDFCGVAQWRVSAKIFAAAAVGGAGTAA